MTPLWQMEVKMQEKLYLRPENESAWSYCEIWTFGRLHATRYR
jgi:hypothetical protein